MKDSCLVSSIHLNLEAAAFVFLISYSAARQKQKIKCGGKNLPHPYSGFQPRR